MRQLVPLMFLSLLVASTADGSPSPCSGGVVWEDRNANGHLEPGERRLQGIKLSNGGRLAITDEMGGYAFPAMAGNAVFLIKPASHDLPKRNDGMPDFWDDVQRGTGPGRKGSDTPAPFLPCPDFALLPKKRADGSVALEVLLFADPQVKSRVDVDYYRRDIVQPLAGEAAAHLGITLGDVVDDDLSLYPEVTQATASLGMPWLHVAGNHDLDLDARSDEDSLRTYGAHFGPDTFAWEEAQAVFVALDNVVYRPGEKSSYVGGLRERQLEFLQAYLPTVAKDRLLVLAMHIPLFEDGPADTFRDADRKRLFDLLRDFPHVLVLSGHAHTQRHWYHDAASGWHGASPLHEYNVGAASGAFWSGVKDEAGIPSATMADGTPNGHARLRIHHGGGYALSWHPARAAGDSGIGLHLPRVLRRGAYPAWGVYANVYMGDVETRVEYRVDGGAWQAMKKVVQPDPALLVENARDDLATGLRGYDRSPEAKPSQHLWRGALPTDLPVGEHRVEVKASDRWRGTLQAEAVYRLEDASP